MKLIVDQNVKYIELILDNLILITEEEEKYVCKVEGDHITINLKDCTVIKRKGVK